MARLHQVFDSVGERPRGSFERRQADSTAQRQSRCVRRTDEGRGAGRQGGGNRRIRHRARLLIGSLRQIFSRPM